MAKKNSAAEALAAAREQQSEIAAGWGSGGSTFYKLEEGKHVLRVFLDAGGRYAVPMFTNNGVNDENKFMQTLNLQWVYESPSILAAAQEAGKLTDEDSQLVAEFGDPAGRLFNALKASGMSYEEINKARQNPITKQRILWAVEQDGGKIGILETGAGTLKWFESTAEDVPDILNRDIRYTGSGSGFQRRYEYNYSVDSEEREPQGDRPDLVAHVLRRVVGYHEKVHMCMRSYAPFIAHVGFSYEDFGVAA